MKWKQNKIIIGMVLMMVLLTSIPMTAFAQMYSGTCIVTVNGKGHGTVSPEGELSVWPGEKITLQIIPDEGYKVSSVSINGVRLTDTELEEVIQTQSYSLTGIYSNTSMDVIFCSETSFNGHTYTVFGSKELCGTAQDPGAVWNDMRQTEEGKFEAVYENLNAGYYEFLIAQDHSWTNVYGSEGTQDPVGVEILEDGGTLKILFDETTGRIATEYEETLQEGQSLSAAESQSVLETADMAENMETASDANIEDRSLAISFYQEEVTDDSLEGTELMESSSSSSQTYRQVTVGYSQGGIVVPPETAWITNQGVVQIPEGETAFFSIVPDTGYQIQDIYIDGIAVTGENKTNAIALGGFWLWDTTQDHSIYVEFASSGQNEGTYRISVTVDGGGTIATSPGFTTSEDGVVYVPQGQSVSLFFYPYEGYQVQQILLDGVQISDQELQSAKNTNSFTLWQVQADHSVSISFGSGGNLSQQRTVSLTAGTGGTIYTADWLTGVTNGTISVSATQGQACQLFLIPDTGYEISQVLIDGASISAEELANVKATQSYTFTQIQGDHSLEAAFSKTSCQISFSAGIGGSLQPVLETSEEGSGTIVAEAGSDVIFQIIPDQGYELAGLSIDGVAVGEAELETLKTNLSYTFYQVSSDHQISAAFLKKEPEETFYVVTSSAGGHGDIEPLGQQKVTAGQTITFSIAPDQGYEISAILIDGEEISQIALRRVKEKNSFSFQPIQENHTIAVEFAEASEAERTNYQIYYLDEDGSEIEELSSVYENASEYVYGTGITLPVQAPYTKDGYAFEGWYDSQTDGNKVTEITAKEKGDKTVYARWKKRAAGSSQTTLRNEWYRISVNGFFTALPELKVEQIKKGNTTYDSMCRREEMEGKTVLAGYRLSVSGGEPDGTLNVTFNLDERMNGEEVTVLQLTVNGTLEKYSSFVEEGDISIQVNELGTFLMGADQAVVKESGVREIHGVALEVDEETQSDNMGIFLFAGAAVVLIGVCIIVGIVTKKKVEKK